tara:strand:- start:3763 stop:4191 length:429 start_codon:yes stop_codon:yes gene_type:complete
VKIRLKISEEYGGGTYRCQEPYEGAGHVLLQNQECPACVHKKVLKASDIKQTVIFDEKDREAALAHLREQGSEVEPKEIGVTGIGWAVAGKYPQETEYDCEATAYCMRCKSDVGTLHVKYDTLFGISEDRRVLSGRYGIVLR